jgi:hypothetical protein
MLKNSFIFCMYYGFNNNIIKAMKSWYKFQKHQTINLFISNVRIYNPTSKIYFQY